MWVEKATKKLWEIMCDLCISTSNDDCQGCSFGKQREPNEAVKRKVKIILLDTEYVQKMWWSAEGMMRNPIIKKEEANGK